ncbi:unnamed protein product [Trypanosoma congolense IL3000]|uniref:WGS project CAEQ00000000 data, annotated contig 425 n=1 Tax=Trypanosoma congolense (strain IL3000) TaxID=1068625 RepID=F9WFU8_TRYCI|nr:unnamed protein product [Trypanosoma congolense IL3000]
MASELKSGPLPSDIEETVVNVMRQEGVRFITTKILRMHLEAKYQIEFTSHKKVIDEIVTRAMQRPEFRKQLDLALKEKDMADAIKRKRSGSAPQEDSKRSKKEAKVKKPEGYPKAARSSFILFAAEHRDKVKAANPEMKTTELFQELGRMWNDASEKVKEKYKNLADEDKARFDREVSEYKMQGGKEYSRSAKVKKDEGAPKRPMTSFMHFSKEFRNKNKGGGVVDVSRAAGAAWNELSQEDRKPYQDMAQRDKERYHREKKLASK